MSAEKGDDHAEIAPDEDGSEGEMAALRLHGIADEGHRDRGHDASLKSQSQDAEGDGDGMRPHSNDEKSQCAEEEGREKEGAPSEPVGEDAPTETEHGAGRGKKHGKQEIGVSVFVGNKIRKHAEKQAESQRRCELEGGYDAHFVRPHHLQHFPDRTRIPTNRASRHEEQEGISYQRESKRGSIERI